MPLLLTLAPPARSIPPFDPPVEQTGGPELPIPSNPDGDEQIAPTPPPVDTAVVAPSDEIVVKGRARSRDDPLVGINAKSFAISQAVDDAVVGPVSRTYSKVLPRPVRSGVHNFLSNLHEPVVAINYLLQLKPGKAAETLGRFALNTTVGVAGLFDMAKRRPFRLPFRPNGFANTLGYYGVKPGPYIFLPIVGATTPRDLFGLMIDRAMHPFAVAGGSPTSGYSLPTGVLHTLDRRSEFEGELAEIRRTDDPYVARRTAYLAKRRAAIERLHGRTAAPSEGATKVPDRTGLKEPIPVAGAAETTTAPVALAVELPR